MNQLYTIDCLIFKFLSDQTTGAVALTLLSPINYGNVLLSQCNAVNCPKYQLF